MPETTYHDMRHTLVRHVQAVSSLASEVGSEQVDYAPMLEAIETPSVISLIGDADAGARQVAAAMLGVAPHEIPAPQGGSVPYYFLHHPSVHPLQLRSDDASYASHAIQADLMEKLCMVELRLPLLSAGSQTADPVIAGSDGVIFILDARDPWTSAVWPVFTQYAQSHHGRLCFFLTHLDQLDPRDWAVLHKHLSSKITQTAAVPVEIYFANQQESYAEAERFLDGSAINREKWELLKPWAQSLHRSMGFLQQTLQSQLQWQEGAAKFAEAYNADLTQMETRLVHDILERVDGATGVIADRGTEIVDDVRAACRNGDFLRSLLRGGRSLDVFYDKLRLTLSETLYEELGSGYTLVNEATVAHVDTIRARVPALVSELPHLQDGNDAVMTSATLARESVNVEIYETLNQMDVQSVLTDQLRELNTLAANRLRLRAVVLIAAGIVGGMDHHLVATGMAGGSLLLAGIVLHARARGVTRFCTMLDEWFMSCTPRMKRCTEEIAQRIVTNGLDHYRTCFLPVLNQVAQRREALPRQMDTARTLFLQTQQIIKVLLSH